MLILEISSISMHIHSHLESPLPPFKGASLNSRERVTQLNESVATLDEAQCSDSIFAGDFNWDNSVDGNLDAMFEESGWRDLWSRCVLAVVARNSQVEATAGVGGKEKEREQISTYFYV